MADALADRRADPKTWGNALWTSIHSIAAGYPVEPDDITKQKYKAHFISLPPVLPCTECGTHFQQFVDTNSIDSALDNNETLFEWTYKLHSFVNKRMHLPNITLKQARITYHLDVAAPVIKRSKPNAARPIQKRTQRSTVQRRAGTRVRRAISTAQRKAIVSQTASASNGPAKQSRSLNGNLGNTSIQRAFRVRDNSVARGPTPTQHFLAPKSRSVPRKTQPRDGANGTVTKKRRRGGCGCGGRRR